MNRMAVVGMLSVVVSLGCRSAKAAGDDALGYDAGGVAADDD